MTENPTPTLLDAVEELKSKLDGFVAAKKAADTGIRSTKDEIRRARKAFADALRRTPSKSRTKKSEKETAEKAAKKANKKGAPPEVTGA